MIACDDSQLSTGRACFFKSTGGEAKRCRNWSAKMVERENAAVLIVLHFTQHRVRSQNLIECRMLHPILLADHDPECEKAVFVGTDTWLEIISGTPRSINTVRSYSVLQICQSRHDLLMAMPKLASIPDC